MNKFSQELYQIIIDSTPELISALCLFIGFFISLPGEFIFENDGHLFTILGFLLMLASFYLMYLNSKQKNK